MSNLTQPITTRNWQEIIANLQKFSEIERNAPPNYANAFLQTAEQLQALIANNGTEAEKEAFFSLIENAYSRFNQTITAFEQAQNEEKAHKARENQEKQKGALEDWAKLPFYAQDNLSDLICIEKRETLEDKIFAISCMFDTLKAIPQLLEIGLLEEGKTTLAERLIEMSKLYVLFAEEQFLKFAEETQQRKGDLC